MKFEPRDLGCYRGVGEDPLSARATDAWLEVIARCAVLLAMLRHSRSPCRSRAGPSLASCRLQAPKVFIKPISQQRQVLADLRPAVLFALTHDQLRRHTRRLRLLDEELGLLDGHEFVGVVVDDQGRRGLRSDEGDR